jgi:hypothetical protein
MDNVLPPRRQLWVIIQEVHDYLYTYLNDPSSRHHPTMGRVYFCTTHWGRPILGGRGCEVCLAGLWYLRKCGVLLGSPDIIPPLATLLDSLIDPRYSHQRVSELLGIHIPAGIHHQLVGPYMWESYNPVHILKFLAWLLEHKGESNV